MIENIKRSYLKSKEKKNSEGESLHWKKIFEKKNFDDLDDLENFRNNGLSYGHDDSEYYDKEKFDKEIKLIIDKIGEKYFYENLKKKEYRKVKKYFFIQRYLYRPWRYSFNEFFV